MAYVEPKTPFEAAVKLIEPYVLRGDDPDGIRRSYLGCYVGNWSAEIRGDKIRARVGDTEEVFPFNQIYQFIKQRETQTTLF
jgi:hypothetical protein